MSKNPELENDILIYNFKTIDVKNFELEKISDDNPLKLVFKMANTLLMTSSADEDILKAEIKLAEELYEYYKVKKRRADKSTSMVS